MWILASAVTEAARSDASYTETVETRASTRRLVPTVPFRGLITQQTLLGTSRVHGSMSGEGM